MPLNKQEFSRYIREFNFRELFNEMGWNNDKTSQPITVDNNTFTLQAVAEKRGFKILVCRPTSEGMIPDYNTRKKIEAKVTKLFQEHLIIFHDAKDSEQIWQLVVRQTGKPTKVTETRWNNNQSPELLFQRAAGIFFEIDEEDHITIVDVTQRIADNFHQNAEKVTKQFYDKFKKEHGSFYDFLSGIDDQIDEWNKAHPNDKKENLSKQWYVSLMLNRLMFCYFIQKKGFLDKNKNYLRDKLTASQDKKGKDKFYSFYRNFLLELFHRGLGEPNHKDELKSEIGRIPYLNGGLFDEHELEDKFKNIQIDDKAFERIFDFFDQYEWHLDTRVMASGKDINPDVIGYIFEKYINDRAQMGAYYTKEDITEYISKNCVLPFLFDETQRKYPKSLAKDSEIWEMLKTSDDRYIYDAVKHGVNEDFPAEIEIGLEAFRVSPSGDKIPVPNLLERRKDWNTSAPNTHALPTEIWREVVERRKRYFEVRTKIENGEINSINDFITDNLNIRQFAQDVIENTNDADFLKAFYQALNSVTIIDPTCGSGAFLFAAMNILEPLYEACLQRMRNFIEDEDRKNIDDRKIFKNKFQDFRKVLEDVQNPSHPNLQYFIYKSIILRNLYGVDIMNEAVEIAKLRLFLKLVATVDADYRKPNLGLEPLPDIDFNIRAGNTLIGFATEGEIDEAFSGKFDFDNDAEKTKEKCEVVAMAFERYKTIQLSDGNDFADFKDAKNDLKERLDELNKELNGLLHKQTSSLNYDQWHASHQPFHWFAEFYEIIHDKGGFDIVIGNPPYVVYAPDKVNYSVGAKTYVTLPTKNLYAFVFERSFTLSSKATRIGLIVQLTSLSSERLPTLQNLLLSRSGLTALPFPRRPESIFDGVEMPVAIILSSVSGPGKFTTSRVNRFYTEERNHALSSITLTNHSIRIDGYRIAKMGLVLEPLIFNKVISSGTILGTLTQKNSTELLYYQEACRYWVKATYGQPFFKRNGVSMEPPHGRTIRFSDPQAAAFAACLLNSSLFYWFYSVFADCEHINDKLVRELCVPIGWQSTNWLDISNRLAISLSTHARRKSIETKQGHTIEYDEIKALHSKPIIDEIDRVLAQHYGFTEEELDFIINYDIKYRMGKELGGESDGESKQQNSKFS